MMPAPEVPPGAGPFWGPAAPPRPPRRAPSRSAATSRCRSPASPRPLGCLPAPRPRTWRRHSSRPPTRPRPPRPRDRRRACASSSSSGRRRCNRQQPSMSAEASRPRRAEDASGGSRTSGRRTSESWSWSVAIYHLPSLRGAPQKPPQQSTQTRGWMEVRVVYVRCLLAGVSRPHTKSSFDDHDSGRLMNA